MKKKRFAVEQIVAVLKEAKAAGGGADSPDWHYRADVLPQI